MMRRIVGSNQFHYIKKLNRLISLMLQIFFWILSFKNEF